ncbi:probable LRR receptor-like serine/threonine-protein kinase At4g29180 [Solanum lycopersicum]|uniref:probable LRR receptor-like serine/threonine-protein kinase At4g29180 n=1 Tax=Solanum lycopersicum TaxID=4081 RepID=UPI003749133E
MANGEITFVETANNRVLSWTQRLEIAIDSAKGLPTNTLLGQDFEAKLSDFGLSKVIDIDEILHDLRSKSLLRERRAVEFVDPKLYGDYSTDVFQLTLELAISCIAPKQQRPSIEKVVDKLEEALAITRTEKASTPHSTPVWSSTSFQEQYRTLVENVT